MGNEMGNRNVNGLQASEQDDTLASTEIYESMKASVVSNNAEDFKDLKKDDIEVITAKGSSNGSTTLNDDDGVLEDVADDVEGDVEEHKTLISKENSTFSMESDGADELKDQKQHKVEETTENESLKSSMETNNAEDQETVTDYLEDNNLLEKDEIENGSRNEFSEALILSSEEQVGKGKNQAIVSMQSLKSDERHTNSIPDVPSATDEEDLIQEQISEPKVDDTIMVSVLDTQSRSDETSPTISTYLEHIEHEEETSNEDMPVSSDEKGVTMEDTNVERPNVADSSVLDLAVEDEVSKKEAEENNEVEEQQCPQSDKFENNSEQTQILESSINSAYLDAIDSDIKRLVISNDLIAFNESVNKNTEAILKDNVLKEIIQTVETKEVISNNLNEQEKFSSLVWEDCNEIRADTSPAEFSAGELEEKVQNEGERSQGKAEKIDLGEANKEKNDGELEDQTVEAEEVVTSKSNQQDELPSLVFEECNEIRADVSLAEFSVGECRSSKDSGHPVSESWSTNDASVFTDIEGKTKDIDAKEITKEEITEKLNQVLPNAPMFEETLTQINSRETAVVLSSQTEVHGEMNLPEAMSTAQESELHTALESELQANMESLISSVNEDGNTLNESFGAASQTENQKQWQDVIHASLDKMAVQQAGGSMVENNETPHVLEENIEESQSSKDATSESTQENFSSEAANTTIACVYLESSHADIQPSELQSLNLALEAIVHESEEEVKAKAVKFEDNPSMDQEKTIRCDVFAIHQDISKTGAESSFPVLQSDNEESDKSPLLYQKNAREGVLSNQERSDSGKLRAPLLSLMKEEVHVAEPVEKEEGLLIKKTVEEVWKSPAKKSMAASPRTREKSKPRSSIFSNCMCCTTAVLN